MFRFTSLMTWETAGGTITTVGETIVSTLDFTGLIQVSRLPMTYANEDDFHFSIIGIHYPYSNQ